MRWQELAQCRGVDVNIFVPAEGTRGMGPSLYSKARNYCDNCVVQSECLEFAIAEDLANGMYGGMTPRERRIFARNRRKAVRV